MGWVMCFSAEASFTAAAVLGTIGCMTFTATSKSLLLLASVPSLFAIQQFAEGVLWVSFIDETPPSAFTATAQQVFLFLAYALWPIWIPLSLVIPEKDPKRKRVIFLALAGGVVIALYYLLYLLPQGITAEVVNHSIHYQTANHQGNLYGPIFYILVVLSPCFVSSLKYAWIFGLLVGIACLFSAYFYSTTFVSIWCFFAALISIGLYLIIKSNARFC
jgi:hypothetical protein